MEQSGWATYATPPAAFREQGIACLGAGEQRSTASFRDRRLSSHAMVYVSRGRGWYGHDGPFGAERRVRAPSLLWIPPGRVHGYGPDERGWTEHWVLFAGVGVQSFVDLGMLDPAAPVVELGAPLEGVPERFAELRAALGAVGASGTLEASVIVQQILLAARGAEPDPVPGDARLIARLRRTASHPMSMEQRAHSLGVSLDTLREVVRATTGLRPVEFVVQARISQAQSLLAETSLDIRTIGTRVGYEDPAYFARVFAGRVGIPPTAFRAQQSRLPTTVDGSAASG